MRGGDDQRTSARRRGARARLEGLQVEREEEREKGDGVGMRRGGGGAVERAPDDERGDDQRDVGETERGSSEIGGAPG